MHSHTWDQLQPFLYVSPDKLSGWRKPETMIQMTDQRFFLSHSFSRDWNKNFSNWKHLLELVVLRSPQRENAKTCKHVLKFFKVANQLPPVTTTLLGWSRLQAFYLVEMINLRNQEFRTLCLYSDGPLMPKKRLCCTKLAVFENSNSPKLPAKSPPSSS